MALFKLDTTGDDISDSRLVETSKVPIDFEKHLEGWLEKSPWAVTGEPIIWIGRQSSASLDDTNIFPDLIGIDVDGNIVIIELKKGRTPRDVVAQLLEYAAWANDLSDDDVYDLADNYLSCSKESSDKKFVELFTEAFELDEMPSINQKQRLFVVAEEIQPKVASVCRFLRTTHGVDINCIQFSVYETGKGERLVSSEPVVGQEDVKPPKKNVSNRWSGDKPVKIVVWEAVQELVKGDGEYIFSPKQVAQVILKKYPNFKKSTVGCQIISDCVGHTSRHHYPGGEDRYWWVSKGQYRLYDESRDGTGDT